MKKYKVKISRIVSYIEKIKANSEIEAIEKISQMFYDDLIPFNFENYNETKFEIVKSNRQYKLNREEMEEI